MAAKTLPDDEIDLDDIQKLEKFCERYPDVADEARMRWLIFCRDSNGLAAKLARLEAKLTALEHKRCSVAAFGTDRRPTPKEISRPMRALCGTATSQRLAAGRVPTTRGSSR